MFVSLLLASIAGLYLTCATIFTVLSGARRAAQADYWFGLGRRPSFTGFAWFELGKSVLQAFPAANGLLPVTALLFLGDENAASNTLYIGLMSWTGFAILFFMLKAWAGLAGYLPFVSERRNQVGVALGYAEGAAVLAASTPLLYVLMNFVAPPTLTFLQLSLHATYLLAWPHFNY